MKIYLKNQTLLFLLKEQIKFFYHYLTSASNCLSFRIEKYLNIILQHCGKGILKGKEIASCSN